MYRAAESKDPGPKQLVVVVGDSITCGVGVSAPSNRFSTVLTDLLRKDRPTIVEVNQGRSGAALCMMPANYPETILQANPDMVVIQWGVNDQYWGYSIAQFAASYERLVGALRRAKADMPIVVTTLVPDYRWPDCMDIWIGEANVMIQEIAARYNCHLADIHRALDHRRQAYYSDAIHPNNAGARVMAETIFRALQSEPLSPANLQVAFDQGREVRFMQYTFLPTRTNEQPNWIQMHSIGKEVLEISTPLPVKIRTAPCYAAGTYQIEIKDATKATVATNTCRITWEKMLLLAVDPKDYKQPLVISIIPMAK